MLCCKKNKNNNFLRVTEDKDLNKPGRPGQ